MKLYMAIYILFDCVQTRGSVYGYIYFMDMVKLIKPDHKYIENALLKINQ